MEHRGQTVMIDALHQERVPGFSTLSAWQSEYLLKYWRGRPDLYLTTHLHPDHYSEQLLERAGEVWPQCFFLGPDSAPAKAFSMNCASIWIDAVVLPHDGKEYQDVTNFGYFLRMGDCNVLCMGDCATTAASSVAALTSGRRVDLAVLNFPWLCLDHARMTVEKIIRPQAIAVVHLPFREDDTNGFRDAAFREIRRLTGWKIGAMSEWLQEAVFSFDTL